MSPCRLIDEILPDSDDEHENISSSLNNDVNNGTESDIKTRGKMKEVKFLSNISSDNVSRENGLPNVVDGHIPKYILDASLGRTSTERKQTKLPRSSRKQNKEEENRRKGMKNRREKFDILSYLLPKL